MHRKIFGYNQWESVEEIIYQMGRLCVYHLVNMCRLLFMKRLKLCSNKVMQSCLDRLLCNKSELIEIQKLYNVDINWSAAKIRLPTLRLVAFFPTLIAYGFVVLLFCLSLLFVVCLLSIGVSVF